MRYKSWFLVVLAVILPTTLCVPVLYTYYLNQWMSVSMVCMSSRPLLTFFNDVGQNIEVIVTYPNGSSITYPLGYYYYPDWYVAHLPVRLTEEGWHTVKVRGSVSGESNEIKILVASCEPRAPRSPRAPIHDVTVWAEPNPTHVLDLVYVFCYVGKRGYLTISASLGGLSTVLFSGFVGEGTVSRPFMPPVNGSWLVRARLVTEWGTFSDEYILLVRG